jgi:L-asparaginase II
MDRCNPVMVEATRGERVESRHRGSAAIVDAEGGVVAAWGDTVLPVFPRSAVKPLQALPLLETGAAERFGVSDGKSLLPADRTTASRNMSSASALGSPASASAQARWSAGLIPP